jgi:hypothetical protein
MSAARSASGCSRLNASSSARPESPGSACGITSTQRHSSGIGWRASSGAGCSTPGRTPPSTTSPPMTNVHRPTAERAPRPAARAIARGSGVWPASAARAAVTASESLVPEPRPTCGGIASRTRTRAPPASPSASRERRATASARSASGPSVVRSSLRLASTTAAGRLSATPSPPNRRVLPPATSSMPMCRRAGASTRTVVIGCPPRSARAAARAPSPRAPAAPPSCRRAPAGARAQPRYRQTAAGARARR